MSWEPIDRCPVCGGPVTLAGYDETGELIENATCQNCGCSFGGAAYWKDPRETGARIE